MISALNISASGMRDAQIRMSSAAHNIANLNTEAPVISQVSSSALANGGGVQTYATQESVLAPDLVSELLNLKLAETAFAANAKAASAVDASLGSLMDAVSAS